jgi:hypothetical protein
MAWRVRPEPWLRRTIDIGPSEASRVTRRRRASSPSAAKIGRAASWIRARSSFAASTDIRLDGFKLRRPSVGVAAICNVAPLGRQPVEARLGDASCVPPSTPSSSNHGSHNDRLLHHHSGLDRGSHSYKARATLPALFAGPADDLRGRSLYERLQTTRLEITMPRSQAPPGYRARSRFAM